MPLDIFFTRHGKFLLHSNDCLSKTIIAGEIWEEKTILPVFDRFVNKDSVVVQIGAYVGQDTVYLARRCWHVYAIEPQEHIFDILNFNLKLNGIGNVTTFNIAAYSKECQMDFVRRSDIGVSWRGYGVDYDASKSVACIAVEESEYGEMRGARVDDVISGRVDFVFSDAQGCDLHALIGMRKLLAEHRPVILFENERLFTPTPLEKYEDFLGSLNYRIETLVPEMDYLAIPME